VFKLKVILSFGLAAQAMTLFSLGGNLEEKWFKDLQSAQQSVSSGTTKTSSLTKNEFESKAFDVKKFGGMQETGLEKKIFSTNDFNTGQSDTGWATKKFETKVNTDFSEESPFKRESKAFSTKESRLSGMRVLEEKKAKEDGLKAILSREKSLMADMRYEGPEAKKIAQELKLINDTLKNKDDLKDHRISIEEIREILNKNQ
jgi:hypothetical protein